MPSVDLIFGPMLVGVFFNCILFGVMVMQMFIYFQTYSKDITWIRYFVIYLFIVETVNTACDMYLIYQPLVQEFGTVEAVTFFPTMLAASPIVTVLISTPVQIFTAWRISIVSQSKIIAILICLFSLVSFGAALKVTINVATLKLFAAKFTFNFNFTGGVWFVASAIADILITVTLVWSLTVRKTFHVSTNVSINRIVRLTVQTGLVTMFFALADLLLFTIDSKTAVSFAWDFSISKLYTNALLSTLNARVGWNNINSSEQEPDNVLFGRSTFGGTSRASTSVTMSGSTYQPKSLRHNVTIGSGSSRAPVESFELESGTYYKPGDVGIEVSTDVVTDSAQSPRRFYPPERPTQ